MFCANCGQEINDRAVICVKCGCAVKSAVAFDAPQKKRPAEI